MGKASRRTTTLDFSAVFFANVVRVCDVLDRTLARMLLDDLNEAQRERVTFLAWTIEGLRKLFQDEAARQKAISDRKAVSVSV